MDGLGPGPRDHLVTRLLAQALREVDADLRLEEPLDPAEARARLARHAMEVIQGGLDEEAPSDAQADQVNQLIRLLDQADASETDVALPARLLRGITVARRSGTRSRCRRRRRRRSARAIFSSTPKVSPMSAPSCEPSLRRADSVDLICAFVIWSGVRHVREALAAVVARGGRDPRDHDDVHGRDGEARGRRTRRARSRGQGRVRRSHHEAARQGVAARARLRASARRSWAPRTSRTRRCSTVLSGTCACPRSTPAHVIDRVRMTFESHWASEHFEAYDPAVNGDELERALREHDRRSLGEASTISLRQPRRPAVSASATDARRADGRARAPRPSSQPGRRGDRHRQDGRRRTRLSPTREQRCDARRACCSSRIARRSCASRWPRIGPCCATARSARSLGGRTRRQGRARLRDDPVAACRAAVHGSRRTPSTSSSSTSSITRRPRPTTGCSTHLASAELLGLTATPERMDGQDVTEWFDNRIAVELRLWEAIDQGFLVPFQYFGVADGTDLSAVHLASRRIRDGRAQQRPLQRRPSASLCCSRRSSGSCYDPGRMRALGFCVSKEHAHFMARSSPRQDLRALPSRRRPSRRALAPARRSPGRSAALHLLGRGLGRGRRRSRCRLSAPASPDRIGDAVRTAARPRAPRAEAQEPPHRDRPDRPAPTRVPLRGPPGGDRRPPARRGPRPGRQRLPVPSGGLHDRPRSPEPRDRPRQPQGRGAALTLGDARRRPAQPRPTASLCTIPERREHRLEDVYRRSWTQLRRDAGHDRAGGAIAGPRGDGAARSLALTHVDDPERVAFYGETSSSRSATR